MYRSIDSYELRDVELHRGSTGPRSGARALLLLAHFDEHQLPRHGLPTISRNLLAETIGTTRSKVDVLMNRFRNVGFLERHSERNGSLQVHCSMLSVVLQD